MPIQFFVLWLQVIPLLPYLYYRAGKIRSSMPSLPPAKGPEGEVATGAASKVNLLVLGESTMAGLGVATHEEGFAGTLAGALAYALEVDVKWKVFARSGYTARDVCTQIVPRLTEEPAELIAIGLGANDAFKLRSPSSWGSQIDQLLDGLQTHFPNSLIVFCHMPPIADFPAFSPLMKWVFGQWIRLLGDELDVRVRKRKNVFYCKEDLAGPEGLSIARTHSPQSALFSDGVHPSPLAYKLWAERVAQILVENDETRAALNRLSGRNDLTE